MLQRRFCWMFTGALILGNLNGIAGGLAPGLAARGSVSGSGTVLVNNEPALSGETLLAGDVVATGQGSTAVIRLQPATAVTVNENTELALSPEASLPTLNLRQGDVVIRVSGQQPARVSVLGASVFVQEQGGFPGICRIASVGRSARVFADRGHVEIHGTGSPTILPPGKYVKLEAGTPQAGTQRAGRVFATLPVAVMQRQGAGPEITVKLSDAVDWQDVVRTLKAGRVRVELLDGSFLNIGARSVMRIVKHDPQTQQTQVEMTLGRMRGEVVKLTKSGGSFQVKTQTAVIGVVGTDFLVMATARTTRVSCLQGSVLVRNINPAILGQVTVHAGQFTSVARGLPPIAPTPTPPAQVQTQLNQTSTQGAPTAQPAVQQPSQAAAQPQQPAPPPAQPAAPAGAAPAAGTAGTTAAGTAGTAAGGAATSAATTSAATTAAVTASTTASTVSAVTASLPPVSPSKP